MDLLFPLGRSLFSFVTLLILGLYLAIFFFLDAFLLKKRQKNTSFDDNILSHKVSGTKAEYIIPRDIQRLRANLFSINGRASHEEYLFAHGAGFAAFCSIIFSPFFFGRAESFAVATCLYLFLYFIPFGIPTICVGIRRAHDLNMNGFRSFLASIACVPLFFSFFASQISADEVIPELSNSIFGLCFLGVIYAYYMFIHVFGRSNSESLKENKYGKPILTEIAIDENKAVKVQDDESEYINYDLEELENVEGATPIKEDEIKEKCLIVNISRSYANTKNMYEATRGNWVLSEQRIKGIELVISEYRGIFRTVYKPTRWYPVLDDKKKTRWAFEGIDVSKQYPQYVLRINTFRKKGMANPVYYAFGKTDKSANL